MASIVAAPIAGFLFGVIQFQWIILIEITTEIITFLITWITKFGAVVPEKIGLNKRLSISGEF